MLLAHACGFLLFQLAVPAQVSLPGGAALEPVLLPPAPAKRSPAFAASFHPNGGWAQGLALADMNGDGIEDLVASLWSSGDVSVCLGRPTGRFAPEALYPATVSPRDLAVGDLNGDDVPDVVVAGYGFPSFDDGELAVLIGLGDGSLSAPVAYVAGSNPTQVLLDDFDLDGVLDIACANSNSFDASVLLGNGDGTFASAVSASAGPTPWTLASGHLDDDGLPDLVVATWGVDEIALLLGGGDGTFTKVDDVDLAGNAEGLELTDLDGDGIDDLVASVRSWNLVSVLLGLGDATFAPAVEHSVGDLPARMLVADVDQDGTLDVATANLFSNDVSLLRGLGGGGLAPAQRLLVGGSPDGLVFGDLNGDEWGDLATANQSGHATVLAGRPGGPTGPLPVGGFYRVLAVSVADVDGNGWEDLVVLDEQPFSPQGELTVLLGNGTNAFQPLPGVTVARNPTGLAVADLNLDGHPDVAVGDEGTNSSADDEVAIFFGQGDGSFAPGPVLGTNAEPLFVRLADTDGEGSADVVVLDRNGGLLVYANDGAGGFLLASAMTVFGQSTALALGDVDADGVIDAVLANATFDSLDVLAGVGDGSFTGPISSLPMADTISGLTLADLDADGALDFVASAFSASALVSLGDGAGGFATPASLPATIDDTRAPVVLDLDSDGQLDVAFGVLLPDSGSGGAIAVHFGRGDGSFFGVREYATGWVPLALTSGDFDGDGAPDLAAGCLGDTFSGEPSEVVLHRNLLR